MVTTLLPVIQRFAGVKPCLGRAYAHKAGLAYIDKGTRRLGVDEKKMCATFVVTTDEPDRVGDIVESKSIYLEHFKKNPCGFYGHQAIILPIGKWEDPDGKLCVWPADGETTATIYFSQKTKDAEQVFDLVVEGILRATSVGFNPRQEPELRHPGEDNPNSLQTGYLFRGIDLLEISIVGIPANPTATLVRECLSRNRLAGAAILAPIRKSLEALAEPAPAWSNGATTPPEEPMSKKWGKKKPAAKLALPVVKAKPTATKAPAKPSLQACVAEKIGTLMDEGMDRDEAIATAFTECAGDKSLGESSGTAGGYTVPDDHDEENKALTAAIVSLTERVDKAATAARKRKKLPPPPGTPDAELPGDAAGDQQEQPPPPPQQPPVQPKGDPREVLTQLVDALTAYLDLTTAKPEAPMEEDEDEEEEEDDEEDADNQDVEEGGTEADQTTGDERYQFRTATPKLTKAAKSGEDEDPAMNKRCKSVCKAAAKHLKEMGDMDDDAPIKSMHKAASHYHRKELEGLVKDMGDDGEDETVAESEDDGESDTPAAPVNKRGQKAMVEEESIDLQQIIKALRPVEERVVAVGNAWANLNGTMP